MGLSLFTILKANMNKLKIFFVTTLLILSFQVNSLSKEIPGSFADLAEKLMP